MAAMHVRRELVLSLAFPLLIGACQTGSSRIERLYVDLENEVRNADPVHLPSENADEVHRQRADAVREVVEKGGVSSAEDLFMASVILVDTSRVPDMDLAEELARKSAEKGEPRGLRVVAEAVDKRAMLQGKAQKYGTQYVFEWVLDSWRLYPVDLETTDAERAQMGVPTYAELLRAEDEMNRAQKKTLRPR
jgi:hypothetical protein